MLVYVDIDETICTGAFNGNYEDSVPLEPRIDKINKLYQKGHTIVYWTARGTKTGKNWYQVTAAQLNAWGALYHELRMGKPAYDLFIDDKNISSKRYFADV